MKNRRSQKEREALLEWYLSQALDPLGYRLGPTLDLGRRIDRASWFYKESERGTQALAAEVQWRPRRVFAMTFFFSELDRERLVSAPSVEKMLGFPLFVHLVDYCGKDPLEVLPDLIRLPDESAWKTLFEQLSSEVKTSDARVWDDLRLLWMRHHRS